MEHTWKTRPQYFKVASSLTTYYISNLKLPHRFTISSLDFDLFIQNFLLRLSETLNSSFMTIFLPPTGCYLIGPSSKILTNNFIFVNQVNPISIVYRCMHAFVGRVLLYHGQWTSVCPTPNLSCPRIYDCQQLFIYRWSIKSSFPFIMEFWSPDFKSVL